MFDLTTLDYIYLGVVLASTIWATVRGGVYETVATLSWIIAAIAARFASPQLDLLLQDWFKLSESTIGTLLSSYFIVFFVILILFGFLNGRLRDKIQESMMRITDHTLGVIFGIIRGVFVMGLVYWGMLWYYSDAPAGLPEYITTSRTRPVMQLTAMKIQEWFVPGGTKLLDRDMRDVKQATQIYENLINPAIKTEKPIDLDGTDDAATPDAAADTGYKSSERTALENQLLQLEASAVMESAETVEQTEPAPPAEPADNQL